MSRLTQLLDNEAVLRRKKKYMEEQLAKITNNTAKATARITDELDNVGCFELNSKEAVNLLLTAVKAEINHMNCELQKYEEKIARIEEYLSE